MEEVEIYGLSKWKIKLGDNKHIFEGKSNERTEAQRQDLQKN